MSTPSLRAVFFRRFGFVLLLLFSVFFVTVATFHIQSYLFARKVHSVLSRMERIQLDKTSEEEVHALLPAMQPGILWSLATNGPADKKCPGDACYFLLIQNVPNGTLFKLREKLNYGHDWIFKTAYWLGYRFRVFGVYVELRGRKVSRYEYVLAVPDEEYPLGGLVDVQVLGANRVSFPAGFPMVQNYEEIGDFRIRIPNNRWTKTMFVAFTPEAQPEEVKNTFDVHLDCLWRAEGCTTDKQLLPLLWEQKIGAGGQK